MNAPMFNLTGQVINVYQSPTGTTKEGKEYGGQDKVQILGAIPLDNGEYRNDLISLTTDQGDAFQKLTGKPVTLPVAFYSPSKGVVNFYLPKGFKPSEAA